tara:strand:+ start:135 stop:992 length:858 start_codon:yes stop_codon:yes gene_type:complete
VEKNRGRDPPIYFMRSKIQQLIPWMHPYKIGVGPTMIFDKPRNKFYWELLKQCKDKVCVEVGFGTGILTLMALHHGAKHIYAYEKDPSIFELGKYIIEELGFSDRVTFVNENYKSKDHRYLDIELIFHEIIGRNIWKEDISNTFRGATTKIVPNVLACNIRLFKGSVGRKPTLDLPRYSTGCEWLDKTYLEVLKDLWKEKDTITYDGISYPNSRLIGSYKVSINNWIPQTIEVDIEVENGIVFPEYYIDDFKLAEGHWVVDKSIKVNKKYTKFIQNTTDGNWWLE